MEIVIRNFEDGFISEDEFVKLLDLFGKSPDDFGFIIDAVIDDDEELIDFLKDGRTNED